MLCIVVLCDAKHKGIANRCTIQPIVVLLWFVCVVLYCYNTTTIRPQYKQSIFVVCCLCVSYNTTTTQNKNTIFQRTIHLSPPQAAVLVWHTNTQRFVSHKGDTAKQQKFVVCLPFLPFYCAVSHKGDTATAYFKELFFIVLWLVYPNQPQRAVLCYAQSIFS